MCPGLQAQLVRLAPAPHGEILSVLGVIISSVLSILSTLEMMCIKCLY